MKNALKNLNTNYTKVTDLIPDKFNFGDEHGTHNINVPDWDKFGWANAICIQSDGKVVVGGDSGLNDLSDYYSVVKRFNVDGSLDATFTSLKFTSSSGHIRDIKQQSTGKLIVVGHFTDVDGDSWNRIVRLNTDGTIDNTFNAGTGFDNTALVVKILSDDSILVGGQFTSYDGTTSLRLAKLGSNGAVDATFAGNVSFNSQVYAIEVNSGNDIYVGGDFSNRIKRLNSDGTTDNVFDVGTGFNDRVTAIRVQSNGKVIVGGWFNNYDGASCNPGVVRLDTDGSLDNSFTTEGTGLNNWDGESVQDLQIQTDGKIVVGGWFIGYNNNPRGRIIRFNTDGTEDTNFDTGSGFSDRVQRIAINSSGQIFCVGFFYMFDKKPCTSQFNYMNSQYAGGVAKLSTNGSLLGTPKKHSFEAIGLNDGGNDMWDNGAYFNTDLTNTYSSIVDNESIPFTHSTIIVADPSNDNYVYYNIDTDGTNYIGPMDGEIKPGTNYFGGASSYFTNVYPGLLVLAADKISIDEFSISGGTGQDGEGDFDAGNIELQIKNKQYVVFYKTSYNNDSAEPAINHLIIVDGVATGITQNLEDGDNSDDHILTGLTGRKELYTLIFGRMDQTASTIEQITDIATEFLTLVSVDEPVSGCNQTCVVSSTQGFGCKLSDTKCGCAQWKMFYPNCTLLQQRLGICNGMAGAYVPAIIVCNQKLI